MAVSVFSDSYRQAIDREADTFVDRGRAGFAESLALSFREFRQEELSVSEFLNFREKVEERDRAVMELTGEDLQSLRQEARAAKGRIGSLVAGRAAGLEDRYGRRVRELAAAYPDVMTDEELEAQIIEESRQLRDEVGRALRNQTGLGKVGSFIGTMGAALTDPVGISTMLLSAPARAGWIAKMAVEAGVAAGTEAFIQPRVFQYKEKLGSPYGLSDALGNVALAGIGAGAFTGLVGAGMKTTQRAARALELRGLRREIEGLESIPEAGRTIEQGDALNVLRDHLEVMERNPFDPTSPRDAEVHHSATTRAVAQVSEDQGVDVSDLTDGLVRRSDEPVDELEPSVNLEREAGEFSDLPEDELFEQARLMARQELEEADIEIPVGEELIEGEPRAVMRSAREVLAEIEADTEAGRALRTCLIGG